jgi:hypothetical protein
MGFYCRDCGKDVDEKQSDQTMSDTPNTRAVIQAAVEGGAMSDQWETFCDVGYYHMWRLRLKTERGWNDGFHINTKAEAEGLCELLNKLEREVDEVREKLADWENSAAHVEADHPDEVHCSCVPILRKLLCDARLERDEAVNNYETAALREHRMQEQRDRLAEALRGIKNELGVPQPEYPAPVANAVRIASQALTAVEGGPQ